MLVSGENQADVAKGEKLFFDQYEKMGLLSFEDTKIEEVVIRYETSTHSSVDYDYGENGTLELFISSETLEEGIKHALAKIVYDAKTNFIWAIFRRMYLPGIFPLITFVMTLTMFDNYAMDDFVSMFLFGPLLYMILTIPISLFLTWKKTKDEIHVKHQTESYLRKSDIFTEDDIKKWTQHYTRYRFVHYFFDYILFVLFFAILTWLVFYLSGGAT